MALPAGLEARSQLRDGARRHADGRAVPAPAASFVPYLPTWEWAFGPSGIRLNFARADRMSRPPRRASPKSKADGRPLGPCRSLPRRGNRVRTRLCLCRPLSHALSADRHLREPAAQVARQASLQKRFGDIGRNDADKVLGAEILGPPA